MDYKDVNDYELLYLIEENNDDAHYILYQKYLPLIKSLTTKYYYNLKRYGVEYEDLFQEAYLAFLRTVKFFDENENTLFYTFLRININSKLLNYVRFVTSQKNIFYTNMLSLNSPLSCDSNNTLADCIMDDRQKDPSILMEYDYILTRLEMFNLDLSPLHSQMFELLCGGFDNKDIASLLDLNIKEVRNAIYRIRKKLKLYLASFQ